MLYPVELIAITGDMGLEPITYGLPCIINRNSLCLIIKSNRQELIIVGGEPTKPLIVNKKEVLMSIKYNI